MNEDKYLLANIEDKITRCREKDMLTHSLFLDLRQRSLAEGLARQAGIRRIYWGGWPDAQRTVLVCLPDYIEPDPSGTDIFRDFPEDEPLTVLRARTSEKAKTLTHRDYLGSLMSLGVKREFVGDILVRPEGADIVILREIREFLMMNYGRAGRTSFSLEEVPLAEILLPEQKVRYKSDTVASLRLDNVISSAFGGSRTSAAAAIKGGLVFVNNLQIEKPDHPVREGDSLVLRHRGKAVLEEIGGKSRKDRQYIKIKIFE